MTNATRLTTLAALAGAGALLALAAQPAAAAPLFSYDASTGQFPTDQGWSAFDIDNEGPLTEPNVEGTGDEYANAVIEDTVGMPALHIRDTLSDGASNLPVYHYQWSTAQQSALLNNGLKFTMVFKGLETTASGKGNVRFGFNGTRFEAQAANIGADSAIEVLGLSAELASPDDEFHTLEIIGDWNGADYEFYYTFNGGDPTPIDIRSNPSPGDIESSVYFGANSSPGDGTDILVKSVTVETLRIPEPASLAVGLIAAAGFVRRRRVVA